MTVDARMTIKWQQFMAHTYSLKKATISIGQSYFVKSLWLLASNRHPRPFTETQSSLTRTRDGRCGVWIPEEARNSSLQQIVNTGYGTHPAFYSVGTGLFPGIKRPRQHDHSPPSKAEAKNVWSRTSTSLVCLHSVDKDSLLLPRFITVYNKTYFLDLMPSNIQLTITINNVHMPPSIFKSNKTGNARTTLYSGAFA
jgi:hypothetical protein